MTRKVDGSCSAPVVSPENQVARGELPRRGVKGVGLLVVTSSGGRWKAPLLVTYGDDVTNELKEKYYNRIRAKLNSGLLILHWLTNIYVLTPL